ncbi:DUF4240 domain-containing protein [Alysiella filiformis]|nr:DUF4240 domain-containing protein [Alysiella filiformis]QMT30583.1 DUF4240 domain-containing protein [Alysiella filiformis]UBQ56439.1 DUF4240 domain-containing protein [Alysiella filiformis DSM 16848]
MSQAQFWILIAQSNKGENLYEMLNELSDDEIFGFKYWWNYFHNISYKQDLWAVAYVVMGGCSDDCFMDFRAWLIAQGQEIYENALKNADNLCDIFDDIEDGDIPLREDWAIAQEVIDEKHGDNAFDKMAKMYSDLYFNDPELEFEWDEDDENTIRKVCPKTFDKWWENDKF